ncbi:MAG: hypothetical protein K1000chlam2_01794 [Chlamydiae bacterium]|nr:hypothetical protein [Chlamydiota bacterium]
MQVDAATSILDNEDLTIYGKPRQEDSDIPYDTLPHLILFVPQTSLHPTLIQQQTTKTIKSGM